MLRTSVAFLCLWVLLARNTGASGADDAYTYDGSNSIKVRLVLIVSENSPPYKGVEAASWEIEIKPGARFLTSASFLPLTAAQYDQLREERGSKGMHLPSLTYLLSGRVLRGDDHVLVAQWNRRVRGLTGSQLHHGDVVQIYEIADL